VPFAPDPGQLPERRVAVHQIRAVRGDALRQALHELDVPGGHQVEVTHDAPLCQNPAEASNHFRGPTPVVEEQGESAAPAMCRPQPP